MEDPPKHNSNIKKNNNRKTLNIGAGAGSFGIGGFVLFGGAIVTATLVSAAFAFKNRRQKQSSSSNKTQTVDSPSDGVTSMKDMDSKTIHDQDEKQYSGTDNDEKVETLDSSKGQDNTLNSVDSDLEREADYSYEKIALDSEQKVDGDEKVDKESLVASDGVTSMASVTVLPTISDGVTSMKEMESKTVHDSSPDEKHNSGTDNDEKVETGDSNEDQDSANANFVDSVLESEDVDKSYEYIVSDSEPRDDSDAKGDTESLVSDETAKAIAEYDAFEEDQMAVEAEEPMQYEKGREVAQDDLPLGNNVSEASNEDIPNGHVDEDQEPVLTNEEAEAAHVNLVETVQFLEDEKEKDGHSEMVPDDMEDIRDIADHEVAAVVHEMHEDEVSQTTVSTKPPTQSVNKETEQKVEVPVTKDDELINIEEKDTEDEIRDLQVIDDQSVERQDNTISRFIDEEETSHTSEQQVTTEDELINKEKDTEGEVQNVQVFDDRPLKREDGTPIQLISKEEKFEEPMLTKHSLVKEDDQTHVRSIKEDEEVKAISVRSQVTLEGTEKSTQEEPTKEEKTGNQNNEEEKTEENEAILGKEQNDSSQNGIKKEDKASKSASTLVLDLSKEKIQALASNRWNLKLQTWSALVSVWCLFHWYSELPFPEVSLVCSLMFILILLGYRNRTTNLVKYE